MSGLETLVFTSTLGFCNVGERCNIAGSIAFKKLILDGKYDDALEVAKKQARSAAFQRAYGILAMRKRRAVACGIQRASVQRCVLFAILSVCVG